MLGIHGSWCWSGGLTTDQMSKGVGGSNGHSEQMEEAGSEVQRKAAEKHWWTHSAILTTLKMYLLCAWVLFRNSSKLLYFCCNVQIYMWICNLIIRVIHTSSLFTFLARTSFSSWELCRIMEISTESPILPRTPVVQESTGSPPADNMRRSSPGSVMSSCPFLVLKSRKKKES